MKEPFQFDHFIQPTEMVVQIYKVNFEGIYLFDPFRYLIPYPGLSCMYFLRVSYLKLISNSLTFLKLVVLNIIMSIPSS